MALAASDPAVAMGSGVGEGGQVQQGWQKDPTGRHQERWYDGRAWSSQVRSFGVVKQDDFGSTAGWAPVRESAEPSSGSRQSGGLPDIPASERGFAPPGGLAPVPGSTTRSTPMVGGTHLQGRSYAAPNAMVSGLIAGAIGGAIGMLLAEILWSYPTRSILQNTHQSFVHMGVWWALVGSVIGAMLASWDSLTVGAARHAGTAALRGAAAGVVAGFVGGYIGERVFHMLLAGLVSDSSTIEMGSSEVQQRLLVARAVGLGILGASLGGVLGASDGIRRCLVGLTGGLMGGAAAAVVFETFSGSGSHGITSSLAACTVTGAGIGLGVGVADRIVRQTWIAFGAGPLRGREIVLFKPLTSVGTASGCDIALPTEGAGEAVHLTLHLTGGVLHVEPIGSVRINGQQVTSPSQVVAGQNVEFGTSSFYVGQRGR